MSKTEIESYFFPETNLRGLNASDHRALTKEGFVISGAEKPTIVQLRNSHCGEKPTIVRSENHSGASALQCFGKCGRPRSLQFVELTKPDGLDSIRHNTRHSLAEIVF